MTARWNAKAAPLAVAILALGQHAHAASFDCAKASTPVETRICADPALSAADEAMARAYAAARAASPTPASLRREQRTFLKELDASSADLLNVYRNRTKELQDQARADAQARRPFPAAQLKSRCVPIQSEFPCKVSASGVLVLAPGRTLLWQEQDYSGGDYPHGQGAVALQPSADGRSATPVIWRAEDSAYISGPALVKSPSGPLVEFQGHMDGTGNFNAGSVFRVDPDRLTELDADSWTDALAKRLPKGLEVWKGVYIDYRTLTASTPLWKPGDGNCCATGGRADVRLRITGDAVVLDQVKVTRGEKAAAQ